jgi:DnaJ-class molecular chaperone
MKIPIKKYVMNENLSWEERYKQLESHHNEETKWMIEEIKKLELDLKEKKNSPITCWHCNGSGQSCFNVDYTTSSPHTCWVCSGTGLR